MEPDTQPPLLNVPEQPVAEKAPRPAGPPKLKPIDRSQGLLRPVIVEELVGPDHKARAIWDLTGQLDLSGYEAKIRSREGETGRAAWNPRLLLSVWLYAYSEQVTSARELERMMEYEPGLMWLSGLGEVNHHTLSDFRADHQEQLSKLLAELLGVLSAEGLITLECVAHDGTKIRAQAGADTFRRQATLEKEIARAEQMVAELDRQGDSDTEPSARREAARQRAALERSELMKQAAEQLGKIREAKKTERERQAARVSLTEPEARIMKHGDQAIAPSYNLQISTDTSHTIIVGAHLSQSSSDSASLLPAMEQVKATMGRYPDKVVADGGFTNQTAITAMEEKQIDFYGSLASPEAKQAAAMKAAGIDPAFGPAAFVVLEEKKTLWCPAGKMLAYVRRSIKRETVYFQYQAQGSDCSQCAFQQKCCPRHPEQGRTISLRMAEYRAAVAQFREKMQQEEAKAIYRKRGPVAEFPNCWIKEKLGLRKFRLRGLRKATTEALWAVLTYDVMQWVRLSWRAKLMNTIAEASAAA